MDEHGNIEVVRTEHGRNVGQMHSNLIACSVVMFTPGFDRDDAAILGQQKMMNGGFVRETHGVIPARIHPGRMLLGRTLLRINARTLCFALWVHARSE